MHDCETQTYSGYFDLYNSLLTCHCGYIPRGFLYAHVIQLIRLRLFDLEYSKTTHCDPLYLILCRTLNYDYNKNDPIFGFSNSKEIVNSLFLFTL